jgi:dihydrofolate reductase
MYETMVYWETMGSGSDQPAVSQNFAEIWRAAEKVVYSRSLQAVSSARTRLEREFDVEEVRRLKEASASDIAIGGAQLAGQALAAGLVDALHLLLVQVVVGGGKRALPAGVRARLELLSERRFASGVVHLHYRIGA